MTEAVLQNNQYEFHPAADAFPLMDEQRLSELASDIAARGQLEPVTLCEGRILDGRNRYLACLRIGVQPKTRVVDGDPWANAWSLNGARRDLTPGQRHAIWKECAQNSEAWIAERKRVQDEANAKRAEFAREQIASQPRDERGKTAPTKPGGTTNGGPTRPKQPTRAKVETEAKAAGVDRGTVERNNWLETHRPDLYSNVKAGVVTTSKAYSAAKSEKRQEEIQEQRAAIESGTAALPEGLYEVVVMDPPWNYGHVEKYDPDGWRVANPYPEMPQSDLLKMQPPFADDCVLFLWTTHQFLWDAKELMDTWGFEYKANMVWDKQKMGMGKWLRMQCEFCLIGVRGKPTWTNTTWRDILNEPRREHSRKPEEFYRMVEEVTVGRRLDFFSRQARQGWEVFGNDTAKF